MNQNQIRVFKDTKKRANEFAAYIDANGTQYPWVPRDLLEVVDVAQPPEDYSEELYTRQEIDDAPYVVFARKSDEQIAALAKAKLQAQIASLEAQNMLPRVTREFMVGWMEERAVSMGLTVEQLRESHFAYRKVKELDEQIATLRGQL